MKPFLIWILFSSFNVKAENKLMVWDVGQGQWITFVQEQFCHHFDIGGEFFPAQVLPLCRKKINQLSLSHWDYDHISFLFQARKRGLDFCIANLPRSPHKWKSLLLSWPSCPATFHPLEVVFPPKISKIENHNSLIFWIKNVVLITGDASSKMEKRLKVTPEKTPLLVVGHHGSLTSSSMEFISRLKKLKMALVSARKQKYGHPHGIIRSRFRAAKIPLLSTNDWGTIEIEIKENDRK